MATAMTADQFVAALKAEGVHVAEHTGWRTHNRAGHGAWGPLNGVLIHHTAGSNSLATVYSGRSDLPGPLAHTHLAKSGTATMVGNGRANHAGLAAMNALNALISEAATHPKPSAASGTTDGNARLYGLEIENLGTGKDPYPAVQYDAAVRWAAAICRHHGWSANSVAGHKETSVEGKVDPSFDMAKFRADVATRLAHPASWNPSSNPNDPSEEDDVASNTELLEDLTGNLLHIGSLTEKDAKGAPVEHGAGYYLAHVHYDAGEIHDQCARIEDGQKALTAKVDALGTKLDAILALLTPKS